MNGWFASVALLAFSLAAAPLAQAQPGLTVRDGRFWLDGQPFRGVGCNYFDLFRRVLLEPTNTTSLAGLEQLARAGIPFVRFAGPYSAKEWRVYLDTPDEYFRRFDLVVRAAEKSGIGLIPSLFWSFALSEAAGEPRGQWGDPQSRTLALMRQYTADVVCRYKASPAVWAWEFGNEKNLGADLPNAAQFRPKGGSERDDLSSAHVVTMLSEFAKAARKSDASRPLLSGNSHSRPSAWHNTAERSWTPDTQAQAREVLLRDNPAPLDTLGIHIYCEGAADKTLGAWATNRLHYLTWLRGVADESRRPVFVGEFGAETARDGSSVRTQFEALLAELERAQMDLAAFWVFDLPNQSKTWNVTFASDRAYMIDLAAEANRRWRQAARMSN
jgi:hypothetical protein